MKEVQGKRIEITLKTDLQLQNELLAQYKRKKVTKDERSLEFGINNRTTARDFLWHIKRIHHWWNCAQKDGEPNNTPPLEIQFK